MPAKYVAIRDSLIKHGKSAKEAKHIAAATYNSTKKGKKNPVGPNYEKRIKPKWKLK